MHYLGLTALVTVCMQLAFFFVAAACKFDLVTDFAGGLNFMVLALLSLIDGGHYHTRQVVVTAVVVACRAELGLFLLFRVCKRGKDARFDDMRERFFAFLGFWIFQMIWVWGVSVSVVFLNYDAADPGWEARDTIGLIVAVVGFVLQMAADFQKYAFRANPDNKGKFCDKGVWKVSRHPNFFGEMMIWWGVFIMVTPVIDDSSRNYGWLATLSPLLTMAILLFLSGLPSAEGNVVKRYKKTAEAEARYTAYRKRTPILIPFIPAVYAKLPRLAKQVLCFEYPMYEPDADDTSPPPPDSNSALTDHEVVPGGSAGGKSPETQEAV